jgi:hypothetical protein
MELLEDNLLFNKTKLIDSLDLELRTSYEEFRKMFESRVMTKQETYGMRRPKSEFHGKIKRDSFKISRTYSAFEGDPVTAQGTYHEDDGKVKIKTFIYVPFTAFLIMYSVLLIIDMLTVYQIVTMDSFSENPMTFVIVILALVTWTILWPYIAMRQRIRKLIFDLEREFHFWCSVSNAPEQNVKKWR